MTKPRVHITGRELDVIDAIVHSALVFFPDRDIRDVKMDMIATHLVCPLDLNRLLDADDFNFVHDIVGIERHLDRRQFTLEHFRPRFAV